MAITIPPMKSGRKPRPSSSFDSLSSIWGQSLRTPSHERRRISMDAISGPSKDCNPSPTSPSRRVSFELDLNSRPIDSFRLPTLSSLKKRRPVAIIKACTENLMNEPTVEHKSVIESSRMLERLRTVQTRSPLLEQKKQELEDMISLKVIAVSKYDLLETSRDASNCVHDLASLYGQISYRLDLSMNKDIDQGAKIEAVKSFIASIMTCFFNIAKLDTKIEAWRETISNCTKLLNVTNTRSKFSSLDDLLKTTCQNVDSAIKSCVIWASKIIITNSKIMTNYFELLPFDVISRICSENRETSFILKKYNLISEVSPVVNISILLAQRNARDAATSFCNMIFEPSAEEQKLDLDSFFGKVMSNNQRDLLKLIYAFNDEKSLFSPVRAFSKSSVNSSPVAKIDELKTNANFCRESDQIYWSNFWAEFKEELLKQTFIKKSSFLESEGLDLTDISFGFPVLESIKSFVVEGSGSEFSEEAIKALDSVYCELHRTLSDKKWSINHRLALTSMDSFKSNKECPDNVSEVVVEANSTSTTKVGHYTIKSLESVVQFIQNCEKGTELTKETCYSLSLTLNTFLNWLNCDEVSSWDPIVAFTLVFGDFEKMIGVLKVVNTFEEIEKYIQELKEVQERAQNKIKSMHTIEWTEKLRKVFPRREYRMKSCPAHVHLWSDGLVKGSVIPTIDTLQDVSSNSQSKFHFLDIFFKSIISIVFDVDHRVKFSKSGAARFMKEIIFLIQFFESHLEQEINLDSVHLLRNFVLFMQQETVKNRGNRISPLLPTQTTNVKRVQFNQKDHFVNDWTCFSFPPFM